jgi:hypothetical protein
MEPLLMMCYQISQNGEPVALVATVALAYRIVGCQPTGFYQVDALEVGEPTSRGRSRARKSLTKHQIRLGPHSGNNQRAAWIEDAPR